MKQRGYQEDRYASMKQRFYQETTTFLVEVKSRDADTLVPIIERYIHPGSVIYSDE